MKRFVVKYNKTLSCRPTCSLPDLDATLGLLQIVERRLAGTTSDAAKAKNHPPTPAASPTTITLATASSSASYPTTAPASVGHGHPVTATADVEHNHPVHASLQEEQSPVRVDRPQKPCVAPSRYRRSFYDGSDKGRSLIGQARFCSGMGCMIVNAPSDASEHHYALCMFSSAIAPVYSYRILSTFDWSSGSSAEPRVGVAVFSLTNGRRLASQVLRKMNWTVAKKQDRALLIWAHTSRGIDWDSLRCWQRPSHVRGESVLSRKDLFLDGLRSTAPS